MEPRRPPLRSLVLVFLLAAGGAFAQGQKFLDLGVKGGLALPSFIWTGDDGWNDITYFAVQGEVYAFACANLSPTFGIELEAGYRGKGCVVSDDYGNYAKWYMDYLEFPVWAKWTAHAPSGFGIYGGLGGYAAIFLGGRYEFSTGEGGVWDSSGSLSSGDSDSPTLVRPLDCGALLVAGMESRHWMGEMRFSFGFLQSMDFTPPPDFGGERGSLNSGIDFLVGYKL
jgi:hypothetical protein